MVLKQKNYNDFVLRLLKFNNFIALDYFNYSIGLFLKTFNTSEEDEAKIFFDSLDEVKISKLLEASK